MDEGVHEGVDVGFVVVHVQRRPRRRRHPEPPHEGLGAVVSGADADPALVEHLREVVRVNALVGEGDHPAAHGQVVGAVDRDAVAVALTEAVDGVGRQRHLVLADRVHARAPRGSRWRPSSPTASAMGMVPGLELPRHVVGQPAVEADVADHLAAPEERRHRFEELRPGPQGRRCRSGPSILWPVKPEEVAADLGHVGRQVGDAAGRRRRGTAPRRRGPPRRSAGRG